MKIVPEVKLDSMEELLNLVKMLPEEGRRDFMSVMINLEDGEIDVKEATEYIRVIFSKYEFTQ